MFFFKDLLFTLNLARHLVHHESAGFTSDERTSKHSTKRQGTRLRGRFGRKHLRIFFLQATEAYILFYFYLFF